MKNHYPTKGTSLWNATAKRKSYPSLSEDFQIDVAIVGAGIAGLTVAYLLKQQGKNVAVFEKYQIGDSVSGYTTAKVSSQHGLIYHDLLQRYGKTITQQYAEANQSAIDKIEAIISAEKIDCGWRRTDSYVYTTRDTEIQKMKDEALAAQSVGLPASYAESIPIEVGAKAAVRFTQQGSFHVLNYLYGLADAVDGEGSFVFEHTKASMVRDGDLAKFSIPGGTVTANEVILATNIPSPILDHIAYGLYEYPVRSYLVAGPIEKQIDDMYISTGNPTRSVHSVEIDKKPWVLVGGEVHMVGVSGPASGHYDALSKTAKQLGVTDITHRWSTWDYVSYDGLPMVGKLFNNSRHLYTLTGFRKWGMTNATMTAEILADILLRIENPLAQTFRANRLTNVTNMPAALAKGLFKK